MKKLTVFTALAVMAATSAFADVTLVNKDVKQDISIKCGTGAVTWTSIESNVTRSIGMGPCTVTVKATNKSAEALDGETLEIATGGVIAKK